MSEKKITILIAEDDEINKIYITKFLERKGYNTILASNGLEAVELCQKIKPDLILMDLGMPILNGLEAAKRIRSIETSNTRTPIIALTAHVFQEDQKACEEAGMDDFITKPFDENDVLTKIKKHLK